MSNNVRGLKTEEKGNNNKKAVNRKITKTNQMSFKEIDKKEKKVENTTSKAVKKKTRTVKKVLLNEVNRDTIRMFHSGKHLESYKMLGAHIVKNENKDGVRFVTWGPNAKNIYVSGDFNAFLIDKKYKMKRVSKHGLWSLFVEDIGAGIKYKYVVEGVDGKINYKSDPYALESELRPQNASEIGRAHV